MKIKRNTSKRPKIGSHGLKVYKGTKVYIGKATTSKPAPSQEIVNLFTDLWNNDPSIKKLRKHIDYIKITYRLSGNLVGTWNKSDKKVTIIDSGSSYTNHKSVIVHEIIGHAFWDFSRKWRRTEITKFNELANKLPPVNSYVEQNERKWKTWNDDCDSVCVDKVGHDGCTRYANEQHSAITELIYGETHHTTLLDDEHIHQLKVLWEELHY